MIRRLVSHLSLAVLLAGVAAPAAIAATSPNALTDTQLQPLRTPTAQPARTARPSATPTPRPTRTPTPTAAPAADPSSGGSPVAETSDDSSGVQSSGAGDFLARNGLTSPMCAKSRSQACRGSGTVTVPVSPGHFGFDTWVEGGTLGLPTFNGMISTVLGWIWLGLVQLVVATFSVLEWAMSFNLAELGGGVLSRVRLLNASWGMPIAAVTLSIGAIWVAIQSFSSRRIGGALASVATSFIVMGLALAVLSNPAGTIGALTKLTAQLGRVAATAPISIFAPNTKLEDGLAQVGSLVLERPYALLEFGDVSWGTDPNKLNPKLVSEARRIARKQGAGRLRRVNAAKSNAQLFLVWPNNSDERNSRKADKCEGGPCLLNVMCGGEEDLDECKGSMARYVQARRDGGVSDRAIQLVLITLGMVAVVFILLAIAFGLLWSFVQIVIDILLLAYLWVLILTMKREWRRRATDVLLRLVGSALALVVFGMALGITITVFLAIQALALPWGAQWVLSIVAMVGLWFKRKEISELMKALLSSEQTNGAAGGFAARLASSYATGMGLGMLRGGSKMPAGAALGASAGMGGGLPSDLPTDPSAGGGRAAPSRRLTAAAAVAGGAVAGPVGSALAAGVVQRAAIAGAASSAGARVAGAAGAVTGPIGAFATRWNASSADGVPSPTDQVHALLEGQQAYRVAQGETAAAALPAAQEAAFAAAQEHAAAVSAAVMAEGDEAQRASLVDAAHEASARHQEAIDHVQRLDAAVERGEQATTWTPADASSPAAQRAAAWLDDQATTPAADRSYGQLAVMQGISPAQWSQLPDADRQPIRDSIDAALATRTPAGPRPSPLEALGQVAASQSWWSPR